MATTWDRCVPRFALLAAIVVLTGCRREGETTVEPLPSPAATPATTRITRTNPPLPAPAEAAIRARKGGLVAAAGEGFLELVVVGGEARVYLYDGAGKALAPAEVSGEMTVADPAHTATVPLVRRSADGDVFLAGGKDLTARFVATITVMVAGETRTAELVQASAGTRGTWADVPGGAAASATATPDR